MSIILQDSHASIIDKWMEQERNGVKFPVDFEIAWKIAGYATKASAKRYLPKGSQGEFFNVSVEKSRGAGRPRQVISLTCDGLKHLCLMADTEQGKIIRQYFIEAEKKWKLVEQHRPDVAHDVEMMKLKIELAQIEAQKEAAIAQGKNADLQLTQFRHYVTTALPEPIQQKILGYETIKETEVVERVIDRQSGRTFDGIGITYIAKALGFKSTKDCWGWLERRGFGKESGKWQKELTAVESQKLSRDDFEYLQDLIKDSGDRQMYLGE